MSLGETFFWGAFGGFGAEALVWFAIRHLRPREYPFWIRAPLYYAIAAVMIGIGGVIALAYARSGTTLNALLAIQIGASAPLVLRKARDLVPPPTEPPDPARVD